MLTETELYDIKKRCELATAGPWTWNGESIESPTFTIIENSGRGSGDPTDEDAEFMAAAREDIPKLLAAVEQLKSVDEKLHELREIGNQLLDNEKLTMSFHAVEQRGFLEGRAYELTKGMADHPDFWQRPCGCDECRSL